jgi:excinuclease ABC subunit C
VKGLFARQAFAGFGPSLLASADESPPLYSVRGSRPARLRAGVRLECPRLPGVYGMLNEAGELIYVGKTKCLRSRLLSYFRTKSRDPKAGRILKNTCVVAWEPAHGEFAALLRELELIRRWRPRFNVQGQPNRRRRTYVCVGRDPAAYVFLSPRPPGTAFACFGPVPAGFSAREAVRRLNDWFRLRDCSQAQKMIFADQGDLFPILRPAGCLRHEINACLGPCAAACTRGDYSLAVRAAIRFLEGTDAGPLEALERDMQEAAAAQAFERAALLRDKWQALHWLSRHLERLRQACRHSCVYPAVGRDGTRDHWHLIHNGSVRAVAPAPRDDAGRARAAKALANVYNHAVSASPGPNEIDGVLLVAAWFRRHGAEKEKTLEPAAALAVCGSISLTPFEVLQIQ